MATALASLLTGRPVQHTVGMTGEVTLQGRVLPIGGLKQKVLAAHAAGLTDVILPERNRADLDDVPADVREAMAFHPVMGLGEVLELALEPSPRVRPSRAVVAASRCPRRSAVRRASSNGAGSSRSSTPPFGRAAVQRVPAGPRGGTAADAGPALTELEEAGVLERRVLRRARRAEYRLTPKGEELGQLVEALQRATAAI